MELAPPIAIVGRACLLPGASSPEQLWDAVVRGEGLLGTAPPGRWGVEREDVLCDPNGAPDRTWTDRGGYVTGFDESFDPTGFGLPSDEVLALDPLVRWLLHTGRQALRDAGAEGGARTGAIFGNLSYPSSSMVRLAEADWLAPLAGGDALRELGLTRPPGVNRFVSGLPAALLTRALGLGAGAFALDAACASSLYAIKLAGDWLASGRADAMLAGAVCCADDLLIHQGFAALGALSRTGQSRPFHRDADGLVPAEGCGFVVLKRLADAVRDGDSIRGTIRGVGLSNDGRSTGLLVPAEEGQRRAIELAYRTAAIDPQSVSLVECHATGTEVGDATELASMAAVFGRGTDIPVGSLKSNLGHAITAAGVAGLIKVLEALRTGIRPPSLHADSPIQALEQSGFRLLSASEPWDAPAPRRAAVSAFGFGGNNAHLVVEEHEPAATGVAFPAPAAPRGEVAIVGIGVRTGTRTGRPGFVEALLDGAEAEPAAAADVELPLERIGLPPNDLRAALGQHTLALAAALEAIAEVASLPWERTGVLIGIEADPDAARYGLRWHLAAFARRWRQDGAWLEAARDEVTRPFDSASVLGAMANMPANRINRCLDARGPSFTISAGEQSGLAALDVAADALRRGELDAALVGAADLSVHVVHEAAAREVLPAGRHTPGDAAVVLVLKRLRDAEAAGDRVYAVLDGAPADAAALELGFTEGALQLTERFGHAYAAAGLLHLAAGALALHHRSLPSGAPWLSGARRTAGISADNTGSDRRRWGLVEQRGTLREPDRPGPRLHVWRGGDRSEVLGRLAAGTGGGEGPATLAIVAGSAVELADRIERAREHLETGAPPGRGVHFRESPLGGEVTFVYTAAGAAYPGMGRELLRWLPELADRLASAAPRLPDVMAWVYAGRGAHPSASDFLWSTSALSQIHTAFTRELLALEPDAMIGYSSGETNTLFGGGVWRDFDAMYRETEQSGMMGRELAGSFDALARLWGEPARWRMWNVRAPLEEVRAAVEGEERVHLAIVSAPGDCVIAGEEAAVARVASALGRDRCLELTYRCVCHVPEVRECEALWLRLHTRPVTPTPGIRYYSNATNATYEPSEEACARALLEQAVSTVDFPATIEAAYADGVRVFVEHGPQQGCSRWVASILGDRPHLAVPLDRRGMGIDAALDAAAALVAAGVAVDVDALNERLTPRAAPRHDGRQLRLPARWAPVGLPDRVTAGERADAAPMPRAPALQPVLGPGPGDVPPPPLPASNGAGRAIPAVPAGGTVTIGPSLGQLFDRHSVVHGRVLGEMAQLHERYLRAVRTEPAGPKAPPAEPEPAPAPDPVFDRRALEVHASGRISEIFGPQFERQDAYERRVRMPEPPLLLADRVTRLDAEPGSMGTGAIWTETDVTPDAWYLHDGRMPAGIMIEAGQADLMLISWLGVDFHNRGERVYRLLGCTLTYEDDLPRPGETLTYEIRVDAHAHHGDVRLFLFHYHCTSGGRPRLTVRDAQAGFFTDEELAHTQGVVWSAESAAPCANPRLDPPAVASSRRRFSSERLTAFSEGRLHDCFGEGFEAAQAHVRSPRIQAGDLLFLDEITDLDVAGGPWRRGYLRARTKVQPDDWYFAGHFKDDPCMPGNFMFEATLQAMAFYVAGMGFTLRRDGWRFQPLNGEPFELRCRGQIVPTTSEVVWEVFVEEVVAGPVPTLYADVLATADGVKAFHGRRIGLQLVPDWPLTSRPELLAGHEEPKPVASADGLDFGYPPLLAAAWGRPSDAFGPRYARFDGHRTVARLPGPPYHFMSRVTRIDGELGRWEAGAELECEYDVPEDAWYFAENGAATMPFAVLLEAALQPCGWLACFAGSPLLVDEDLAFRNLDGTGTVRYEVGPDAGTLRTVARLSDRSRSAGMILTSFDVACHVADRLVYELRTVFGFFPPAALAAQVGLPTSAQERRVLHEPSSVRVDLASRDGRSAGPRLAGPMLLMLDRITGFWPGGGAAGLGVIRAEKDVDPSEWFFKAHFFQDPVQPGSLGMEALLQLLQWHMLETGMTAGMDAARFEPIAIGMPVTWKYRGQVVPTNDVITTTIEITETGRDERGPYVVGDASLWVDGMRIYEVPGIGMRAVA